MKLRHRPGCDPREQTPWSCPCGVTQRWAALEDARAESYEMQADHERGDQ